MNFFQKELFNRFFESIRGNLHGRVVCIFVCGAYDLLLTGFWYFLRVEGCCLCRSLLDHCGVYIVCLLKEEEVNMSTVRLLVEEMLEVSKSGNMCQFRHISLSRI